MKYYLIGEKDGKKVVILGSPHKKMLEDLSQVLLARGHKFKFEILEGLDFRTLIPETQKTGIFHS